MTIAPRDRVPYAPIVGRPAVRWPNGARLAVWVVPNVEHLDYLPHAARAGRASAPRVPAPDVREYAWHDHGNRVGFWRLTDVLDAFDIRATVSLNVAVLEHYPEIAGALRARRWAIMSHGIYNLRFLYELGEADERAFYAETLAIVRRLLPGVELRGMLGPGGSASERTPDLMAEAGFSYHADWVHDDQPVPLRVERGRLVSVPYTFELNDGPLFRRRASGDEWEAAALAQFDRLYREGAESGRVLCLPLHPYRLGQALFVGHLRRVLEHMKRHAEVWWTTGDDIAQHYLDHHYDAAVEFAASIRRRGLRRG